MSEGENIKDTKNPLATYVKDSRIHLSYNRVNKLIKALYIVTDIIEKDEPVRYKLRALGTQTLSDILAIRHGLVSDRLKMLTVAIEEIISLIDVASTVGLISEMNASVLKKEFGLLGSAITEVNQKYTPFGLGVNIDNFFTSTPDDRTPQPEEPQIEERFKYFTKYTNPTVPKGHSIGQSYRTKLGLQSGKTLLGALQEIKVSKPKIIKDTKPEKHNKLERFNKIKNILKDNKSGLTISDIKMKLGDSIKDISEKTLQRELLSLTAQGILKRAGEKRWSRYFLNH